MAVNHVFVRLGRNDPVAEGLDGKLVAQLGAQLLELCSRTYSCLPVNHLTEIRCQSRYP
jgi:hypothetical protein